MMVASFHHWVESPPSAGIISDENRVGEGDGDEGGDPDQPRERRFEVHFRGVAEARFLDGVIDEYAAALAISMMTRMTKIHTSN